MNQEVLMICESIYHHNTLKIAQAMKQTLNCQLMTCEEALKKELSSYAYIGLGSGIYFTAHHPKVLEVAKQLNPTQKVFIFSTHGAPLLGHYHDSLKAVLKQKNIEVVGEFSCKGYDATGPFMIVGGGNKGKPNERDEERAKAFVTKILPSYCKRTDVVKKGRYVEVRSNECSGCGRCVSVCPMHVFELSHHKAIVKNAKDCVHCLLCQKNCPAAAISVQHSWREAIAIAKRHAHKKSL